MFLTAAKIFFELIGTLFALLLTIRTFYNFKNNKILPVFVSFIAGTLVFYVISGLGLAYLVNNNYFKFIILIFTASPFIIGKVVTYKKLRFYSIVQILSIIISILFVYTML